MATSDEIATLRRAVNEPGDEYYSDVQLGEYIDNAVSIDEAAALIWEEKAARASNLVNVSESGSSRSMNQIYSNALEQAKFYRGKIAGEDSGLGLSPSVTPIERP